MKKIIIFFLSVFLLVSCGWEEEDTIETSTQKYSWEWFSIDIPASWEVVEDKESTLPAPKEWEIALAVTSSDLKYGFANNMIIMKQKLNKPASSTEFSMINNIWASSEYIEYEKIDTKDITFVDQNRSVVYIFEAKYAESTPKLKYLQIWKVCNEYDAYLLTIALSLDTDDLSKYEELFKTFSCSID